MAKKAPVRYVYRVIRWVKESYEVESKKPLTMDKIKAATVDPASVIIERETIQQVFP